eukprot:m.22730 g.22730  ORF g.22730 m.22730 type:complete len:413 (+) comp5477_c0_seq3:97-1335(+)
MKLEEVKKRLELLCDRNNVDVSGGKIRRTSSRFCFGVEHGDYNGTELFGVGTDRFIWMAHKATESTTFRLVSENFEDDGVIEIDLDNIPPPQSSEFAHSWARFPLGVLYILQREQYTITKGMNAALVANIPGGGMSRSASLTLNILLSIMEINNIPIGDTIEEQMKIIDLAQAVETDYIGAPVGKLDQIMIFFAKENMGTHYKPESNSLEYVALGDGAPEFSIVSLDTGTDRPGLEKSTYKVRRKECDDLAARINKEFGLKNLAAVKTEEQLKQVLSRFQVDMPDHCDRLKYIYAAQQRFSKMISAWKRGDIETVGLIFREDGHGLRDEYAISGKELESMCDIVRSIPGVLGERMLGGGDKGASGCIVLSKSMQAVRDAVDVAYPRAHPIFKDKYAVHECRVVDGVVMFPGL